MRTVFIQKRVWQTFYLLGFPFVSFVVGCAVFLGAVDNLLFLEAALVSFVEGCVDFLATFFLTVSTGDRMFFTASVLEVTRFRVAAEVLFSMLVSGGFLRGVAFLTGGFC